MTVKQLIAILESELPANGDLEIKVWLPGSRISLTHGAGTLIRSGNVPYTIVRSTQFFEFLGAVAKSGTDGGAVRLPPAHMQPIAADDVAAALADVVATKPLNGMVELAGPEPFPMDELVRRYLSTTGDSRPVIGDANALYFGVAVNDRTLTPGDNPRIGKTSFEHWLSHALVHV